MTFDLNSALPLILLGLALLVFGAALVFFVTRRKTTVIDDGTRGKDVLDEGAERARRNQALIDAAPAAVKPAPEPLSAAANSQPVAAEPLGTDAEAGPQVEPTTAPPSPAASASTDDLTRIKGIGPKLVALLAELGVTSYAQIASWSEADVARVDARLGRFAGRITRDQWIAQAQLLSAGDETAFAQRFGNNG